MELPIVSNPALADIREDSPAQEIVAWSLQRFSGMNLVMISSFGMEGCALIDMYAAHKQPLTVIYLDTMFFFDETYALRDQLVARYPHLTFVNRGTTLTPEEQARIYGDNLWKRDPDQCCKLRKVDPMLDAMQDVDVYISGLRRSQSATRANLKTVAWDWKYQALKICPLAAWERSEVWEYVKKHDVPFNALHEQGYPTVGCTHCTQPVEGTTIGEYSRSGRWKEFNKTECGLHGDGI